MSLQAGDDAIGVEWLPMTEPNRRSLYADHGKFVALALAHLEEEPVTAEFVIEAIKSDIDKGLGIVPVVGGGMSVPSGIPAGEDYRAYLFHCLTRVFDSDERWDPGSFRWPQFSTVPTRDDLDSAMWEWATERIRESKTSNDIDAGTSETMLQAMGAVRDWRATLDLLSRIEFVYEYGEGRRPLRGMRLKESDPRIIDSFFVNLTKGKRPNTAHMLLAHLADVLRVKVILTTNFDELIESAFQRFDMPVATFDVHYDAGFPDARSVRAHRSVVKINGGRYGLRADFTLDKLPSPTDVANFTAYLSLFAADAPVQEHQRNLMVIGVSGRERRTIALMCEALIRLPRLRVYWLCPS